MIRIPLFIFINHFRCVFRNKNIVFLRFIAEVVNFIFLLKN